MTTLREIVGAYRRGNPLWTPEGWRPARVGSALHHEQLNLWEEWLRRRSAATTMGCVLAEPRGLLRPALLAHAATATTHKAYETIASVLTTEINSLANSAYTAASAAQGADGTGGPLAGDFEFVSGGAQTASNGLVGELYLLRSADGTNYETTPSSTVSGQDAYAGTFMDASGSTTKRAVLRDVPNPPGLWKAVYKNVSGASHAATNNTVKVRHHSLANA